MGPQAAVQHACTARYGIWGSDAEKGGGVTPRRHREACGQDADTQCSAGPHAKVRRLAIMEMAREAPSYISNSYKATSLNLPPSPHPSYEYARRCRTASASMSSTGSVCVQLKQASVIDTPYLSGTPGFRS